MSLIIIPSHRVIAILSAITLLSFTISTCWARGSGEPSQDCVASLSQQEKNIYDSVSKDLKPGDDLTDAIRSHVRPMVMNGQMDKQTAMQAAKNAGACLKQRKQ